MINWRLIPLQASFPPPPAQNCVVSFASLQLLVLNILSVAFLKTLEKVSVSVEPQPATIPVLASSVNKILN